jgi:5-deoxy-D-glucuronate isomerase
MEFSFHYDTPYLHRAVRRIWKFFRMRAHPEDSGMIIQIHASSSKQRFMNQKKRRYGHTCAFSVCPLYNMNIHKETAMSEARRYPSGQVIDIRAMNTPIPSSVITESVYDGVMLCSLGKGTETETLSFEENRLICAVRGDVSIRQYDDTGLNNQVLLKEGQLMSMPLNSAVAAHAETDAVIIELAPGKGKVINEHLRPNCPVTVFDLVHPGEGKTEDYEVISNGFLSFKVLGIGKGAESETFTCKTDGIVTAVSGHPELVADGKSFYLESGQNFRFGKNTSYSFRAGEETCIVTVLTAL